jgi:hypothetical protein
MLMVKRAQLLQKREKLQLAAGEVPEAENPVIKIALYAGAGHKQGHRVDTHPHGAGSHGSILKHCGCFYRVNFWNVSRFVPG